MNVYDVIDKTFGDNTHSKHRGTHPNILNIENRMNEDNDNFYLNFLQTIKQKDIKQSNLSNKNAPKRETNTPKKTHFNPLLFKDRDCLPSPIIKHRNTVDISKSNNDKASKTSHLHPRKLKKEESDFSFGNILDISGLNLNKDPLSLSSKKRVSACSNFGYLRNLEQRDDLMKKQTVKEKQREKEIGTNISNANITRMASCRSRKTSKFRINEEEKVTKQEKDKTFKENTIQFEIFSDNQMIHPFPIDILQIQKITSFKGYKSTKETDSLMLVNEKTSLNKHQNKINDSNNNNNIIIINQNGYTETYLNNQPLKKAKKKKNLLCCIPIK